MRRARVACARTSSTISRSADAEYDYAYEERWIRDEGYLALMPRAISAALGSIAPASVSTCSCRGRNDLPRPWPRPRGIAPRPSLATCTRTAATPASPTRCCCSAPRSERARAGDSSCVAGFGQGCDVVVLRATGPRARQRAAVRSGALASGVPNREYVRFLSNCGLVDVDWGMRAERDNRTAQPAAWRRHRDVTAFVGGRCRTCGTVQFPLARACVNPACRAFDTQDARAAGGEIRDASRRSPKTGSR